VGLHNCSRAVIFLFYFIFNLGAAWRKKKKKIYSVFSAEGNRLHLSGEKESPDLDDFLFNFFFFISVM
jgi:hypothetical protein